jgi:hypothetical protein
MQGRAVSDSDSPEDKRAASFKKSGKPFTDLQRWQNLTDAMADDALTDKKRPTKMGRERAQRARTKLDQVIREDEARLDREAAEPGWEKRTAKKNEPPGSGHVM